jgi:acetyl esterase/lipase
MNQPEASAKSCPVVPLWAEGEAAAPPAGSRPEEIAQLQNGLRVIRNVSQPTLTVYLPDPAIATGTGVIVCPGGAYHFLAFEHEGIEVARALNRRGIAAFLLKYRLVPTGDDFPQCVDQHMGDPLQRKALVEPLFPLLVADGCQAMRVACDRAAEWGLDPERIGMLGFSAGGRLTLGVALQFDVVSRPAFIAAIYSAPPLEAPMAVHAPPLFLLCTASDDMASTVSLRYYSVWRDAGHPVELHIYAQGRHGFGMTPQGLPLDSWFERFMNWLQAQGFLPEPRR